MFGICDETSAFLGKIYEIDTTEKRPLLLADIPSVPDHSEPLRAADELAAAWQAEKALASRECREPSLRSAILTQYWRELVGSTVLRFVYEACNIASPFCLRYLVLFMGEQATRYAPDGVDSAQGRGFGYGLAVAFAFITVVLLMSLAYSTALAFQGLQRLACAMMLVLQRKLVRLPAGTVSQMAGKIQTLCVTETQSIMLCFWIGSVVANPVALVGNIIALYFLIDWPGLLGASVLLLFAVVQGLITSGSMEYRSQYLRWAEVRVRRVTQALGAAKLIKMYGWEKHIEAAVGAIRRVEVGPQALSGLIFFRSVIIGASHCVPQLAQLAVFATVFGIFGAQTAESMFPVIVLLNSARITVASFSLNLNRALDLRLSIDRWQEFLVLPERSDYVRREAPGSNADDGLAIAVVGDAPLTFGVVTSPSLYRETRRFASSAAAKSDAPSPDGSGAKLPDGAVPLQDGTDCFFLPILEPLALQHGGIKRGSLTLLTGRVSAGKSLLCAGLVGVGALPPRQQQPASGDASQEEELAPPQTRLRPVVHRTASPIVVCAAEPWILNTTLRENIVMANVDAAPDAQPVWATVDAAKYALALWSSGLHVDLASLPRGDLTEIGSAGLNLSGGQRARLQLARAVYTARDDSIVFLDDVLSAVDPSLVASLFHECILGALGGTTRILVSHQQHLFAHADRVLHLDNRRVAFDGSPAEFAAVMDESRPALPTKPTTAATAVAEKSVEELAEGVPSVADGAATAAAASPTTVFGSEAELRAHVAEAFANGFGPVDGRRRASSALDEGEKGEDPTAGKLTRDEVAQVGSTKWSTFGFYAAGGGTATAVFIQVFFLLWRGSVSVSDMFLSLWTTTNANAARAAAVNSTGSGNATRTAAGAAPEMNWTNEEYMTYFAIAIAASVIAIVLRTVLYVRWVRQASARIHDVLFSTILRAPMSHHDTTKTAEPVSRLSKDMEQADVAFSEEFLFAVSIAWNTLGLLVTCCVASVYLTPFIFVLVVFYERARRRFATALRALRRLQDTTRTPAVSVLQEIVCGIGTGALQQHSGGEHSDDGSGGGDAALLAKFERRFTRCVVNIAATYDGFRNVQRWILEAIAWIGTVLVLLVSVIAVTIRVVPELSAAVINTSFLSLGISYSAALALNLSYSTSTFTSVLVLLSAIERIQSYIGKTPQEDDCEYAPRSSEPAAAAAAAASSIAVPDHTDQKEDQPRRVVPAPPSDFPADGRVEFRNVNMRYRPGLPLVLKDVSFAAASGEKIGIVGRSGDSKSTLSVCLFRLAEIERDGGAILLAGRDIRDIKLHELRTILSTIPQDASTAIFAGTVRSNLSPFSRSDAEGAAGSAAPNNNNNNDDEEDKGGSGAEVRHTDADLVRALELVGLKQRILAESGGDSGDGGGGGLDAVVEAGGSNFSSGERQLLVLARALLRRSRWLLLDEATSNTDDATDAHMQAVLSQQFPGVTMLIIAHRVQTLIHCDKILVMNKGRVAEFASPAALLRDKASRFHGMVSKLGAAQLAELTALAVAHERARANLNT